MKIQGKCDGKPRTYGDMIGKVFKGGSDTTYLITDNINDPTRDERGHTQTVQWINLTDNTSGVTYRKSALFPVNDYTELPNARVVLE